MDHPILPIPVVVSTDSLTWKDDDPEIMNDWFLTIYKRHWKESLKARNSADLGSEADTRD